MPEVLLCVDSCVMIHMLGACCVLCSLIMLSCQQARYTQRLVVGGKSLANENLPDQLARSEARTTHYRCQKLCLGNLAAFVTFHNSEMLL